LHREALRRTLGDTVTRPGGLGPYRRAGAWDRGALPAHVRPAWPVASQSW